MEPGKDSKIFTLKMDRTVAEVKGGRLDIKEDEINVALIKRMYHGYINMHTSYQ